MQLFPPKYAHWLAHQQLSNAHKCILNHSDHEYVCREVQQATAAAEAVKNNNIFSNETVNFFQLYYRCIVSEFLQFSSLRKSDVIVWRIVFCKDRGRHLNYQQNTQHQQKLIARELIETKIYKRPHHVASNVAVVQALMLESKLIKRWLSFYLVHGCGSLSASVYRRNNSENKSWICASKLIHISIFRLECIAKKERQIANVFGSKINFIR